MDTVNNGCIIIMYSPVAGTFIVILCAVRALEILLTFSKLPRVIAIYKTRTLTGEAVILSPRLDINLSGQCRNAAINVRKPSRV